MLRLIARLGLIILHHASSQLLMVILRSRLHVSPDPLDHLMLPKHERVCAVPHQASPADVSGQRARTQHSSGLHHLSRPCWQALHCCRKGGQMGMRMA